jgi:predicted DNA binding CopG/RHH family protein
MQLSYRGISYQFPSKCLATVKQEINGQYRGIPYQRREIKDAMVKDIYVLKYRGVEYIKFLH